MREIKFRVWDIQKEKFIPSEVYAILNRTDFNAFGIMTKDWENYREGEYFYDNAQILQQYTGLKDKNGVEIYEGDKASYRGKIYEIRFSIDYGCYGMFDKINNRPLGRSGSSTKYEPYFLNNYHLRKIEVL